MVVGRINIQDMQGGHVGCGQQDSGPLDPSSVNQAPACQPSRPMKPRETLGAPRTFRPVLRGSWLADCAPEVPLCWYLFPVTRPKGPPVTTPVLASRPLNSADGA